jgi:hypothetical protein
MIKLCKTFFPNKKASLWLFVCLTLPGIHIHILVRFDKAHQMEALCPMASSHLWVRLGVRPSNVSGLPACSFMPRNGRCRQSRAEYSGGGPVGPQGRPPSVPQHWTRGRALPVAGPLSLPKQSPGPNPPLRHWHWPLGMPVFADSSQGLPGLNFWRKWRCSRHQWAFVNAIIGTRAFASYAML